MIRLPRMTAPIAIALCFLLTGCSLLGRLSTTPPLSFDTTYSAPKDWKLVDDGKWGLRLNVPPTVRDTGFVHRSLWIHEGTNLRVIIDFGSTSPDSLKQQPHYSEARVLVNGLPALVISCESSNNATAGSLNKVVALFFLEKRKQLGAPREPSYRVEYASDDERTVALQILQTVRLYDS